MNIARAVFVEGFNYMRNFRGCAAMNKHCCSLLGEKLGRELPDPIGRTRDE
eukprot:CAMPEP_0119325380 /NCGR_PEP_ID=MMETSP1333-20130426/65661_1 /TAXON_ID=418940 /ORGANISM="Scyphosphaera apsteinii, Strain RCC1455" /LENGTH=50 /DNA_ID=CAMNT_0007333357 /DNA_START=57 /DNA_END=206 /DNA_ORIENTATION=+